MNRLCRKGHDLSQHGRLVQSPSRPLHMRCNECRRISRIGEHSRINRARRLRIARQLGAPETCEAGHQRSEIIRVVGKGGRIVRWRCLVCQPAGSEVK